MAKAKPNKPYDGFPLTAHQNGQWCKKIRGRVHYFGPIEDWKVALDLYLEQRDDLQAGRTPKRQSDGLTLGYALDHFLSSKKLLEQSGEISRRSYADYERIADRIAASLDRDRALADIDVGALHKLRADLSKGKNGRLGAVTVKGDLTRARMVFLHINEFLGEKPIPYRKPLKSPSRRQLREVANVRGPRMFEADEIKAMIAAASPQLQAMIYLGINCGFGNSDCGNLPLDKIDLVSGWHTYWRGKTHNPRRCPLWPETVEALRIVIETRPKPATKETAKLVFLTRKGNSWSNAKGGNSVSGETRKLLKKLGTYRENITSFYNLRRTFETIGATAGDQVAVDYIMGHIAPTQDMAAVYRQKTFDSPLLKVTNHIRDWFNGAKIE